ncbi:cupin domain-containing protein [Pseudomonadales bacterium]|nr:cupin domain-containing protein [Pseudomonadales bacterium]MDC1368382.1 cupin domain-containing protein [Pseudomonadales bacterium]
MIKIEPIDVSEYALDIHRDLTISARKTAAGPPQRMDGMTVGIITMTENAPHGGEMHPDGDEILCVISGKLRITGDSLETEAILLPGQACIVPKGEWHRVYVLEKTQMVHITPGPNGEHRPLAP